MLTLVGCGLHPYPPPPLPPPGAGQRRRQASGDGEDEEEGRRGEAEMCNFSEEAFILFRLSAFERSGLTVRAMCVFAEVGGSGGLGVPLSPSPRVQRQPLPASACLWLSLLQTSSRLRSCVQHMEKYLRLIYANTLSETQRLGETMSTHLKKRQAWIRPFFAEQLATKQNAVLLCTMEYIVFVFCPYLILHFFFVIVYYQVIA